MPNRKHYSLQGMQGWQAQPHITQKTTTSVLSLSDSLCFYIYFPPLDSSPPWPPWQTFTEGLFCFLWVSLNLCSVSVFPTLWRAFEGQFISWCWLIRHPPLPLSLLPLILPVEAAPNRSGFLWIFLLKKMEASAAGSELPVIISADIPSWIRAD